MTKENRYMMATKAIHKLGDISRDKPDICSVYDEDDKNYIGQWVTGFGFFDVKFPKETTRELTEEEHEKYNGTQVVIGSGPPFTIYTKEPVGEIPKEAPILILPKNKTRRKQLKEKLEEYRERGNPYRPPEMQMDNVCKITVLERLLKDNQVNTWELAQEMFDTYGNGFCLNSFNNACAVIEDYCKTGGKNVSGGTSLKNSSSLPISSEV